ncbi:MAG: hypothetical protein AB7F79_08045 [Steroidobacteraceae bacterium]
MTNAPVLTELKQDVQYRLKSLDPTTTPQGSEGTWFRYVIAQGENLITGLHSGNKSEVDQVVRDMVERLNERLTGKSRPRTKPAQK